MSNTDHLFFGLDFEPASEAPINFIETRFHDLSPFSAHEIEIDGETFKTVEHAYQSLRIVPGPERDAIKAQRSPMDAWREGQKYKHTPKLQIPGYDKYALMEKICRAKIEQHPDIAKILLETDNRTLVKGYDTDYDWGTGADGSGANNYGKLWMRLRSELQSGKPIAN